jgi:hypothetical protein
MAVDTTAGVRITGELLSAAHEEGLLDNGKPWSKGVVKVLVGDSVERVSWPTLEEAEAALDGAERGSIVTLPVRPQGAFDEATGRRSRVTYRGGW